MITVIPPSEWAPRLREFTARNACRHITWERRARFADREVQTRPERHAPFLGATYDPWERDIRVLTGDRRGVPYVRTNAITEATRVAVITDDQGRETELLIEHPGGAVVLQFAPGPRGAPCWPKQDADQPRRQAAEQA